VCTQVIGYYLLQVHHHCSPRQLLERLVSNTAVTASNTTCRRIESVSAEAELLQRARDALGARHVVRICGRDKGDRVSAALQRLVDNAAAIRNAVNLSVRSYCVSHKPGMLVSGPPLY
jgi:glycosyltransferase A (GT-A) superfamily protein (DUF2064 family)